ncbi:vacuolar protein [Anaeramoeba flamelloides]|uniref:Vacuolar protein n=1 Tax=Anaeramoeba flamelloides TaxID=1746091 RepID=A0AAV7YI70_9EUKA|nr:vacuolar protein [Anaeramoeba flamelloides]
MNFFKNCCTKSSTAEEDDTYLIDPLLEMETNSLEDLDEDTAFKYLKQEYENKKDLDKLVILLLKISGSQKQKRLEYCAEIIYKLWGDENYESEIKIPQGKDKQKDLFQSMLNLLDPESKNTHMIVLDTLVRLTGEQEQYNLTSIGDLASHLVISVGTLPILKTIAGLKDHKLQRRVVAIIANVSYYDENHEAVAEIMVPTLIDLLTSGSKRVRRNSLIIFHRITRTQPTNENLAINLDPFFQLLKNKDLTIQYYTLATLSELTTTKNAVEQLLEKEKTIHNLFQIGSYKTNEYINEKNTNILQVLIIFKNICVIPEGQIILIKNGVSKFLFRFYESSNLEIRKRAVQTTAALVKNNSKSSFALVKAGAISKLFNLIETTDESMVIQEIIGACRFFAEEEEIALQLTKEGLIQVCSEILSPTNISKRMTISITVSLGLRTCIFQAMQSLIVHHGLELSRKQIIEHKFISHGIESLGLKDDDLKLAIFNFFDSILSFPKYRNSFDTELGDILDITVQFGTFKSKNQQLILRVIHFVKAVCNTEKRVIELLQSGVIKELVSILRKYVEFIQHNEVTDFINKTVKKILQIFMLCLAFYGGEINRISWVCGETQLNIILSYLEIQDQNQNSKFIAATILENISQIESFRENLRKTALVRIQNILEILKDEKAKKSIQNCIRILNKK